MPILLSDLHQEFNKPLRQAITMPSEDTEGLERVQKTRPTTKRGRIQMPKELKDSESKGKRARRQPPEAAVALPDHVDESKRNDPGDDPLDQGDDLVKLAKSMFESVRVAYENAHVLTWARGLIVPGATSP